jgi:hypothetical protein
MKFEGFNRFHEIPDDGGAGGGNGGGDAEAAKKLAFERDQANAKAAKFQKELDDLKKALPTDEQKARWADLEKAQETAEEERKRKAGEFDAWRTQIAEKHAKDVKAQAERTEAEAKRAESIESELNNTLKGLAFAGAADLFGPTGKTVLTPAVAQAYFAHLVQIVKDEATGQRSVVVKDGSGATLVDPKTGHPMEFGRAMKELIEAHPDRDSLLRGSGKVGSNSAGGANGGREAPLDAANLTPEQRRDPKVLAQLRASLPRGGMVSGRAYEQ